MATNLDEDIQKVESTIKTPALTPCVPTDVGLINTKILDEYGFLDHIIHWLKSKLGRTNDVTTAFYNAVKIYLSQLGCKNEIMIAFLTYMDSYPDPVKKYYADHVNQIVNLALVNIAKDVAIINSENFFL